MKQKDFQTNIIKVVNATTDYAKNAIAEEIYNRTKDDITRPLLKDNSPETIKAIYEQRKEIYDSYADITVDTTGKMPDVIVDEIVEKLKEMGEYQPNQD